MMTIGLTIDVPEPWQDQLRAARISYGDPGGETIPAHITILGPTEVPAAGLEEVGDHLRQAVRAVDPFEVRLGGTGTFRPVSPVVFVQVVRGARECEALEAAVRSGVLARDTEFAYHPHVTVAHGIGEDQLDRAFTELADFEATFTADHVTLAVLCGDDTWRPVRSYPLGA